MGLKGEYMKGVTLDMVVAGLVKQGYIDIRGSHAIARMLKDPNDGQLIQVYYDNNSAPNYVIIKEAVPGK